MSELLKDPLNGQQSIDRQPDFASARSYHKCCPLVVHPVSFMAVIMLTAGASAFFWNLLSREFTRFPNSRRKRKRRQVEEEQSSFLIRGKRHETQ